MGKVESYPTGRPYAMYAFWALHTLMLVFFLILESSGFRIPVGSTIFYFTWIALWLMHGLTLMLGRVRKRERRRRRRDNPFPAADDISGAQLTIYGVRTSDIFVVANGEAARSTAARRGAGLLDLPNMADDPAGPQWLCHAA